MRIGAALLLVGAAVNAVGIRNQPAQQAQPAPAPSG